MQNTMNILVTLDKNYVPHLNVMLYSLKKHHSDCHLHLYVLHSSLSEKDVSETREIIDNLTLVDATDIALDDAPTTSRYPREIYYRIFASRYLPDYIDKILYLDPDIIVNGRLDALYNLDIRDYFFAAASHIGSFVRAINGIRLDMEEKAPYINSGVMLMNLNKLRAEQSYEEVFAFIDKYKSILVLPDQDIISSLYGTKILAVDTFRYNMTEKLFMHHSPFEKSLTLDWIRENTSIIHYCGRNKPWKENYTGYLDVFYKETVDEINKSK